MIFEDPSKTRKKIVFFTFHAIAFIAMAFLINVIIGYLIAPPPPNLETYNKEYARVEHEHGHERGFRHHEEITRAREGYGGSVSATGITSKTLLVSAENSSKLLTPKVKIPDPLPPISQKKFLHTAFVTQWDPNSVNSLKNHLDKIDIVFPDWFTVTGSTCNLSVSMSWDVYNMIEEQKKIILPRLSNVDSKWRGKEFSELMKNEKESKCLIESLTENILYYNARGINIDIEDLDPKDRDSFTRWISLLTESFHKNSLYVTVDLPVNSPVFDYETIGQIVDNVIIMAYDEHYAGGKPGPIASDKWYADSLDHITKSLPPQKIMMALGTYSYDWNIKLGWPAKNRGFDETIALARNAGAKITTDSWSINSSFKYYDQDGNQHEVWMLDGVSLWNQYLSARDKNIWGASLWRLWLEDPSIWKFYGSADWTKFHPKDLSPVENLEKIALSGSGEILKVAKLPEAGKRSLSFEGKKILKADYEKLPQNFIIDRFWDENNKIVALTFDDGPSKEYTWKILDVLKKYNVAATFFLIGEHIEKYPDLVRREFNEGHLIGNHTFSHGDINKMSVDKFDLELNETQRLIASVTGRQTLMFRAPYNSEMDPHAKWNARLLEQLGKMGYISVGAGINSYDYNKPGAQKIAENVLKEVSPNFTNIVLLHDAGGDRSQTAEALDILIPELQKQGYRFVTVNEIFGVSQKAFMPPAPAEERFIAWGRGLFADIKTGWWEIVSVFFFVATFISILRIIFIGLFVVKSKRDESKVEDRRFHPPVTVLVPAYNEEKVIERTITGLLASHYPRFEILVIDDGSKDGTAERVANMAKQYDNVRLITKKNEGKSKALNLGFQEAKYEYIVTVDADTIVFPKTIYHLMQPFANSKVDAVCGNIGIGNVKNILTAFQEVEYVTGQNYDRRAFEVLNCISVVPGATGAWKKQSVIDAGGYSEDTLTEDADLTLALLEKWGKVVYAPNAKSVTEAPETVQALFKQRFRWSYGTFQCFWKHRKSFGKGTLGNVALPNIFFFQMILPLLSPIGDIVFLLALFTGNLSAIVVSYIAFVFIDSAASGIAYLLDQRSMKNAWVVFIQRFFYRQFMYLVTFQSILAAFTGDRHGWNKLERKATVQITEA